MASNLSFHVAHQFASSAHFLIIDVLKSDRLDYNHFTETSIENCSSFFQYLLAIKSSAHLKTHKSITRKSVATKTVVCQKK